MAHDTLQQNISRLDNKITVGIAAGVSTPEWLIIDVTNIIAAAVKGVSI